MNPIVNPIARPALQIDNRHVYGIACSWNGPIAQVAVNGGLPACPHCKGMLFEQDADDWNSGVAEYAEAKQDPVYPRFIEWLSQRGTCSTLQTQEDLAILRLEFASLHIA